MLAGLLVIVPSRGRPESVARMAQAWTETGAYDDGAWLLFAVDGDDPHHSAYLAQASDRVQMTTTARWVPMVPKLNQTAMDAAGDWWALGFAGDDHIPRTPGWAGRYLTELRDLGTGIVYGDDGYQGANLPTQWVMTANIVRALGRMVPAPVEHLYCDNSVLDLGRAAGCIRYTPDVLIEHMHPVVGKAETDAQYRRTNHPTQFRRDRVAYQRWQATGLGLDAATVRALAADPVPG
jgi:hypothetical protein